MEDPISPHHSRSQTERQDAAPRQDAGANKGAGLQRDAGPRQSTGSGGGTEPRQGTGPGGGGDAGPRRDAGLVVLRDPNRLSWPPTRTDLLTGVLTAAFGYCLIENRSFAITVPILFAAVFTGISPRMRGQFGWRSGGGSSLGGEFTEPFTGAVTLAELDEPLGLAPPPGAPPRTGSGGG